MMPSRHQRDCPLRLQKLSCQLAMIGLAIDAVPIYLVNSQQIADLRRYYQRHAKSDRIDARVLAQLPLVNPDKLHRLVLPAATAFACQRA